MFRIVTAIIFLLTFSTQSFAHCQIPCGIYDDATKLKELLLDVTTIEKSIEKINSLSAEKKSDYNQLVRWVNNKEDHANNIIDNMANYYLAQRVKIKEKSDSKNYSIYQNHLEGIHSVIKWAMKAKQSSELEVAKNLRKSLEDYGKFYEKNHH